MSTTSTSVENMHMGLLMNKDAVQSDILTDLNEAKQHELEESPAGPAYPSYTTQAAHTTHSAHSYEPAPEQPYNEAELTTLYDNPKITQLMRSYELLPPRQQKGRRFTVLNDLKRYQSQGYVLSQDYDINSDYYEMLHEKEALLYMKNRDGEIGLTQTFLLTIIKALETLNNRYDPVGLRLNGMYETTFANIEDYREIIGELLDKYRAAGSGMEPEHKLALMLIGGIATNHFVQTSVENTMAQGTIVEKKGKEQAFNQYKKVLGLNAKKKLQQPLPQPPPRHMPHIPVGGYQPQPMPQPPAHHPIKEYKNTEEEQIKAYEADLNAELENVSVTSLDTHGKPKRRKSGKALQM